MLLDIVRMPPVFGIPLDRKRTIYSGGPPPIDDQRAIIWPHIPLYGNELHVGSMIDIEPTRVYKAIHAAQHEDYIFETVFAIENEGAICLYTKIITPLNSQIAISLQTIKHYQQHPRNLLPLTHFLAFNNLDGPTLGSNAALIETNPVDHIVPPVFGESHLYHHIDQMASTAGSGLIDSRLAWSYKPIYDHIPHVMEALIGGWFIRSPFHEIPQPHPAVDIVQDKWFSYESLRYRMEARGFTAVINHAAFDNPTLRMMLMFPVKFTSQMRMCDVIERNKVAPSWTYTDSYGPFLGNTRNFIKSNDALMDILFTCVMAYCQIYQFDYTEFLRRNDDSSIAISKNAYDEIEINFTDLVHNRFVCFYSSFPALALATLSVGWNN